eukprot:322759-Prymnesium_polylepis.1
MRDAEEDIPYLTLQSRQSAACARDARRYSTTARLGWVQNQSVDVAFGLRRTRSASRGAHGTPSTGGGLG